jgi:glucokinase
MIAVADNAETIAVADIGGTHARFAIALVSPGAKPVLGDVTVLATADFPSLAAAYETFAGTIEGARPRRGSFALACPIRGETLKFTNNPWTLRPAALAGETGLEEVRLLNDFGAVGHAAAHFDVADLVHVSGPAVAPPRQGIVSILGPGTGLGVAQLILDEPNYKVVETEGGHIDFAPRDALEDALLARLRHKFGRVSIERVVSGPGLADIRATLSGMEEEHRDDAKLWAAAISGADPLARTALEKFWACLGGVAGDVALLQGAHAVMLAGGLSARIAGALTRAGFVERFVAKGRYREMMANIPVWLIVHPQPGLFGAAAAFRL